MLLGEQVVMLELSFCAVVAQLRKMKQALRTSRMGQHHKEGTKVGRPFHE
jgi:hypothetical protein